MAFALLGHTVNVGGGGAASIPAQNTVGAKLIVLAVTGSALSGVPTDSLGNVYLQGAAYVASPSTNTIALFYCLNPLTSGAHTFAYPGSIASMAASWWSANQPSKDQQNASGTASPGSITPASNGALIVTGCSAGGGAGTVGSAASGCTLLDGAANNGAAFGLSHAYVVQASAAPFATTWTGSGGLAAAVLLFVDAPPLQAASTFAISSASATLSGATTLAAAPTVAIGSVGDFTPPGLWATSSIRFAVTTALRTTPILRATASVSLSTAQPLPTVDYLIVSGGGGGGQGQPARGGGGGGGGGVRFGTVPIASLAGAYSILVGIGGAPASSPSGSATNGGQSAITTLLPGFSPTVQGGGGGSSGGNSGDGKPGACGGGAGDNAGLAAVGGAPSQGFKGGNSATSAGTGGTGGGGGGQTSAGAVGRVADNTRAAGGTGLVSTISGAPVTYSKGGDGGGYNTSAPGAPGTPNTGNGGDGAGGGSLVGGAGGSGVVVISYVTTTLPDGYAPTGGTITVAADRTIHTFTSSGTFYFGPRRGGRTLIHLHRLPRRTRMLPAALLLAVALVSPACASIAPAVPRFVAIYEQRSPCCRIEVVRDTRTPACFVVFKCSRQPVTAIAVAPDVCVP